VRLALAAAVFAAMLGIRLGPIPDDDDDPIVDYGPHLFDAPSNRGAAESAAAAAAVSHDAGPAQPHRRRPRRLHTRAVGQTHPPAGSH
jgi:hypothetical protein